MKKILIIVLLVSIGIISSQPVLAESQTPRYKVTIIAGTYYTNSINDDRYGAEIAFTDLSTGHRIHASGFSYEQLR